MKKNYLLKTVLLFFFTVLFLNGCRQEEIISQTYQSEIQKEKFRILKLTDLPLVESYIKKNS